MTSRVLFGQAFNDHRRWIVPLVTVAAINLGVYLLAVYPLSLKVAASERRATADVEQLRLAQRDSDAVHATLSRTEEADRDLARFYHDALPADLSGARRLTYARLAALAATHNLAIERRSYSLDEQYRGRLQRLVIAMTLSGEYRDVRAFLYAVETAPEFVTIEDVGVAESSRAGGGLAVGIRLATYFPSGASHGL